MFSRRAQVLVLTGLVLAAGGFAFLRRAETLAPDVPATATAAPRVPLMSTTAPAKMSASMAPIAASGVPMTTTLAARVDVWSRSGDPQQAMQAYKAIFQCLLARRRAHAPDMAPQRREIGDFYEAQATPLPGGLTHGLNDRLA